MTLQEARRLHAFNSWATNRIFEACAALSAEELGQDLKSSHRSILGTLTHLVGAERIWLSRFLKTPENRMVDPAEVPTLASLKTAWEKIGFEQARWLGGMNDRTLAETFVMTTSDGTRYTHTFDEGLRHLVDHSTYHRGQVVTLLRQLGHTPPNTGMIRFFRETRPGT